MNKECVASDFENGIDSIILKFVKWQKVTILVTSGGQVAIYVVLGILILAFLFFIINTIRCYLNRPQFDEEDDEEEPHQQMKQYH